MKIISPKNGETVHGQILIEAVVSNSESVHHLDFYFQEPGAKDRYGWKDYVVPYFWGGDGQKLDTTMFDDGPASVVAFCKIPGLKKPVAEHRVHFAIDNGKPCVKILTPREEENISGEVFIRIDAADTGSIKGKQGIAEVNVYLDGKALHKFTKAPFQAKISTCLLFPGRHSIRVVAEDTERMTTSHTVMINIR